MSRLSSRENNENVNTYLELLKIGDAHFSGKTYYNMKLGAMGDSFGHFFAYALYGVICIAAAIFVWKLVPETKGKTLEDMTALWRGKKQA